MDQEITDKVYLGDCLDILKKIPKNSIDCIVTDPPYGINYNNLEWDAVFDMKNVAIHFNRLLKNNGSIIIFTGWSSVCKLLNIFNNFFELKDWIIYDRIKGRGGRKSLTSTREDILWFVKDVKNYTFNKKEAYSTILKKTGGMGLKNNKIYRSLSNVWTDISPIVPWSEERVKHPTQKPIQIISRILEVFTNENNIILDPFAGSGTTGVVCKKLNRRYILIEKEKEYYKIIKERLRDNR